MIVHELIYLSYMIINNLTDIEEVPKENLEVELSFSLASVLGMKISHLLSDGMKVFHSPDLPLYLHSGGLFLKLTEKSSGFRCDETILLRT